MAKQSQVKARRKIINPVFHRQTKKEDDDQLTPGMIKVVRKSGQLNLSGRSLATVPNGVFTMYETKANEVNFDMKNNLEDPWWSFKPLVYIDLSSNVLTSIPTDIKKFEDVTVLNLQDNNLTELPAELGSLTKLTKLNLSRNKINKLPKEFSKLVELQQLNLSHNCLEDLEESFVDIIMLQVLDLSYNRLTQLPTGMGYLVRLSELNLSNNQLSELPLDLVNMRALLKLDVTHNNLKSLPLCIGELRKLQTLFAQHNDIEEIPTFEGCEHLQELHLGNNFIKQIPSAFCENMSLLKILDLRDNQIEKLPDEIAMLQHIIRLDLTNNELTSLPNSLGLLSHLQNIQIEGNKLKSIRQDIIKGGTCKLLKHLRDKLDLEEHAKLQPSANQVVYPETRVFPDKYMMRNSKALNLSMKDLQVIPENVFQDALEAEVHIVDLNKNKLQNVPSGLQVLADNTTELNLSTNKIKDIPLDIFADFIRLQYLDLGRNLLSNLPECLKNLINLRELVLSYNSFSTLPECIYELKGLEILLASDNQINKIDVNGLKKLSRLATLDLSNNNIDNVPLELGNMTQLRCLEIKGNSFRLPRYAILEQGTDSILSYLRDRIPK